MKFWKLSVLTTALALSGNASAATLSVDWQMAGDNLITLDTDTGLEWLDLTATTSRSYNDISTAFGVGQEFDGWRYATMNEISVFFDAFGGNNAYYNSGWTKQNNGLFDSLAPFWGDPYCAASGCQPGDGTGDFIYGVDLYNRVTYGRIYDVTSNSSLESDYIRIVQNPPVGNPTVSTQRDVLGHALVRTSPVPVPPAIWLFGTGLLGLVGFARRVKITVS